MHEVEVLINAQLIKVPDRAQARSLIYLRDAEYAAFRKSKTETITYASDEVIHWRTPFAGPNHVLTIKHVADQKFPVIVSFPEVSGSDKLILIPDPFAGASG